MFLKHIDLTTALRPSYLPGEVLLFVQDNVGLYEGYAASAFPSPHGMSIQVLMNTMPGNTKSPIIKTAKST